MGVLKVTREREQVTVAGNVLYTCPDNTFAEVTFAVAVNVDASNNTALTITATPKGGSAATYVPGRVIPAAKSDPLPEMNGFPLDAGDSITVSAGAEDDINVKFKILETTQ